MSASDVAEPSGASTVEQATDEVLAAFDRVVAAELDAGGRALVEALTTRFPDADDAKALLAADEVAVRDEHAAAAARQRLADALPEAFAVREPQRRRTAVYGLLADERERLARLADTREWRALSVLSAAEAGLG